MIRGKKKVARLACSLALAFLVVCFVPLFGERNVSANPYRTTLYYFSDNPESSTYKEYILENTPIENCYLYYELGTDNFWSMIDYLRADNTDFFTSIEDACVIFETLGGFPYQVYGDQLPEEELLPNILSTIFEGMQSNNCKIMFICGTDENRIEPYTEFLDYVDIHINVDMFYLFFANAMMDMAERCGNDVTLEMSSFFFNEEITSQESEHSGFDGWFFKRFFTPYFLSAYRGEFSGTLNPQLMFSELLWQEAGSTYYDALLHQSVTFDVNTFAPQMDEDTACAIGMGDMEDDEWFEDMLELREWRGYFPIYIYTRAAYPEETDVYCAGNYNDYLPIIEDFLVNGTLSNYDNIEGRCVVTHRPLEMSENGWLQEVPDGGTLFFGLNVIMSEEDAAYYSNSEGNELYINWEGGII